MSSESPEILRTFSASRWPELRDSMTECLPEHVKAWEGHGWSLVGSEDALRVVVNIDECLASPEGPVAPVTIGPEGDPTWVKPAVRATHASLVLDHRISLNEYLYRHRTPGLAPGHPIEVGRGGSRRERVGIAAICEIGGEAHLVTCGHAFRTSFTHVYEVGGERPIAKVVNNFLHESDGPLDLAVARLTSVGRARLARGTDGPVWTTSTWEPHPSHHRRRALFYPTNPYDQRMRETTVISSWACEYHLLPGSAACGLIETGRCSVAGDSGAPLHLVDPTHGRVVLGLCSGKVGTSSFFTPMATALARMRAHYDKEVSLWKPE